MEQFRFSDGAIVAKKQLDVVVKLLIGLDANKRDAMHQNAYRTIVKIAYRGNTAVNDDYVARRLKEHGLLDAQGRMTSDARNIIIRITNAEGRLDLSPLRKSPTTPG